MISIAKLVGRKWFDLHEKLFLHKLGNGNSELVELNFALLAGNAP